MNKIQLIKAREILDSRGNPTVEVEMSDGQYTVRACVPSGASTGSHEALELRDKDEHRYQGKGVLTAVAHVNTVIAPAVLGMDPGDQESLDSTMIQMDGTENKSKLGANAILGVSLSACRLAAEQKKMPLFQHIHSLYNPSSTMSMPRPMMNILNGGTHSDAGLAIQEFMIFPKLNNFSKNLQAGSEIFHTLKKILKEKGYTVGVGDEGGFAPHIAHVSEALDTIMDAIKKAGYKAGSDIELAIDAAASEFYSQNKYKVDDEEFSSEDLANFYEALLKKYPISSLEDSHSEDDFSGFALMQKKFGSSIQLVGDDLFVTNKKRLQIGIDQKLANAILIKVNQIGSLSETFDTMRLAHNNGFATVISHRSGETEDPFIADLAVGTGAGQIKTGSLSRSERICKYNQLLRIFEKL